MSHFDFTIIQSSIDNGRIYFDACHKPFFPADALGGRGKAEHASGKIQIEVYGEMIETDIRESSSARISPRNSVKSGLKSVGATNGANARLHPVNDRQYALEYLG
jgi:hypothetical protein